MFSALLERDTHDPHNSPRATPCCPCCDILDACHHITNELASCDHRHAEQLAAVADKLKATAEALRDAEEMLEWASR